MPSTLRPLQTYSCRAECRADIDAFLESAGPLVTDVIIEPSTWAPDCTLEFRSAAHPSQLLDLLESIPDTHVMVETLRPVPLSDNTLERTYAGSHIGGCADDRT